MTGVFFFISSILEMSSRIAASDIVFPACAAISCSFYGSLCACVNKITTPHRASAKNFVSYPCYVVLNISGSINKCPQAVQLSRTGPITCWQSK